MPKVELRIPDGTTLGSGVGLFLDGQKISDVRAVTIDAAVDSLVTLRAEVFATERFNFTADASVEMQIVASPEYEIVVTPGPNGATHYRAVKL